MLEVGYARMFLKEKEMIEKLAIIRGINFYHLPVTMSNVKEKNYFTNFWVFVKRLGLNVKNSALQLDDTNMRMKKTLKSFT